MSQIVTVKMPNSNLFENQMVYDQNKIISQGRSCKTLSISGSIIVENRKYNRFCLILERPLVQMKKSRIDGQVQSGT